MDQKVKERWIAALESGEYPKGKYALCYKGNYCCLGVLAEIEGLFTSTRDGFKFIDFNNRGLPPDISDFYFQENKTYYAQHILEDINDSSDTFESVIKFIRKNL